MAQPHPSTILELFEKARKLAYRQGNVVPMDLSAETLLPAIQPDCLLYIACGEETLAYVDLALRPTTEWQDT